MRPGSPLCSRFFPAPLIPNPPSPGRFMYHHMDLFHILPVFVSLSHMGNRSGLHVYLYGSIYFPSPTQKHDMLILIRSHWARLVQGLLAAMNMVSS